MLIGGQVALDENGVNKNVRAGQPIRSEFVRVEDVKDKLFLDDMTVPLVEYRGERYFDLEALKGFGYGLSWNRTDRTWTVAAGEAEGPGAGSAGDIPVPERGALMLERGYRAVWNSGGKTGAVQLLSVGERVYAPLSLLAALGWDVTEEAGGARALPPAAL